MSEKKKILVLGTGMVTRPHIEYLTCNAQNEVTVGKTIPILPSYAPKWLIKCAVI
jgi:hypothetical protein